ncbi:ferredoxin [Halobaculum gomorrense]|uniref:Ferredoxin n=1 Tax=Halobaculum gomorrense TaxID=43928 RepID=A0A1M5PGP0_9EURY|nr:ferredoxin [Halobaculum gomorrense]SHH00881.1 ferredoxin [Halobaculum gomorrense]
MSDRYTVTVDREACDGVFACLVRDDRFVEAEDGLAALDPTTAVATSRSETRVSATFERGDGGEADARQAAAACPLDAITVDAEGEP